MSISPRTFIVTHTALNAAFRGAARAHCSALRIATRDRGEASLRLYADTFLIIVRCQRLTAEPLRYRLVESSASGRFRRRGTRWALRSASMRQL